MSATLDPQQEQVIRAVAILAASISVGGRGTEIGQQGNVTVQSPVPVADLIDRADHIANYIREGRLTA